MSVSLELCHVIEAPRGICIRDMAVASAGAVFVVTDEGVREYDSRSREVSRPFTEGSVISLDVFSDGRVAAGLRDGMVSVLSRDEAQFRDWRVTATFKSKVWPSYLAVAQNDSCLSVADDSLGGGRVLCVYSCSGQLLLEKDLAYRIWSLASSTAAVVVSSWSKREPLKSHWVEASWREPPLEGCTVEAYDYSGHLLWQRTSSNLAYDLCPDPGSIRVYMTVYGMSGVRVLKGEGQQGTEEAIVSGSEALQEPWRISVDRRGRYLAVIHSQTVTVFSVVHR